MFQTTVKTLKSELMEQMRDGAYTDSEMQVFQTSGEDTQSGTDGANERWCLQILENAGVSLMVLQFQSELMEQMIDGAYTDSENTGVSD